MFQRFNRAARRAQRERLIARRHRENLRFAHGLTDDHQPWLSKQARMRARTGKFCSCVLCGNPRRFYGNALASLSRQELKQQHWRAEIE